MSKPENYQSQTYGKGNTIPDSHLEKFTIGAPSKKTGRPPAVDRFLEQL